MKINKEHFELALTEIVKAIGYVVGLFHISVWLFIILELFLYSLVRHTRLEVFVIQFPITLWVLTKKDGK